MAAGSSSAGMRLDLSQKSVSATVARFYKADADCQAGMQAATKSAGEFCRELTAFYAPKRTLFMSRNVRTIYSSEGLSFETGWLAEDFSRAGLPFYPPYQEFGTQRMAANPSLYPAYKETQRYYQDEIRANIRAAVERRARVRSGASK